MSFVLSVKDAFIVQGLSWLSGGDVGSLLRYNSSTHAYCQCYEEPDAAVSLTEVKDMPLQHLLLCAQAYQSCG